MRRLLISRRLRVDLSSERDRVWLGAAHYSYGNVADKFQALFKKKSISYAEILRPEIYPEVPNKELVHLIFKPFEEIRVLHGARNIAHVAWEFRSISTRDTWLAGDRRFSEPFQDYVAMMRCVDEVWVGSSFAAEVFKRHGIVHSRVVPAPIELPRADIEEVRADRALAHEYHAAALDNVNLIELNTESMECFAHDRPAPTSKAAHVVAGKQVFLTIANHGDLRKNFPALLDGFSLASRREDAVLIIKLVMDNKNITKRDFAHRLPALYQMMRRQLGEISWANIYLTSDYLTNDQMNALFLYSDFYLSPTLAEGQNLPLLEAMASGVIPICGRHTAMLDYASAANAIIIESSSGAAPQAFRDAYGIDGLIIDLIYAEEVAAAVTSALALSSEARRRLQDQSWEILKSDFSDLAVAKKVHEALG